MESVNYQFLAIKNELFKEKNKTQLRDLVLNKVKKLDINIKSVFDECFITRPSLDYYGDLVKKSNEILEKYEIEERFIINKKDEIKLNKVKISENYNIIYRNGKIVGAGCENFILSHIRKSKRVKYENMEIINELQDLLAKFQISWICVM